MKRSKWMVAAALAIGLSAGAFAENQPQRDRRDDDNPRYTQQYNRERDRAWNNGYSDNAYRDYRDNGYRDYGYREDRDYRGNGYRDGDRDRDDGRRVRDRDHRDRDYSRRDRDDRGRDRD